MKSKPIDFEQLWRNLPISDIEQTRQAQAAAPQASIQTFSGQAFFLGRVDAGELPDLIHKLREKK